MLPVWAHTRAWLVGYGQFRACVCVCVWQRLRWRISNGKHRQAEVAAAKIARDAHHAVVNERRVAVAAVIDEVGAPTTNPPRCVLPPCHSPKRRGVCTRVAGAQGRLRDGGCCVRRAGAECNPFPAGSSQSAVLHIVHVCVCACAVVPLPLVCRMLFPTPRFDAHSPHNRHQQNYAVIIRYRGWKRRFWFTWPSVRLPPNRLPFPFHSHATRDGFPTGRWPLQVFARMNAETVCEMLTRALDAFEIMVTGISPEAWRALQKITIIADNCTGGSHLGYLAVATRRRTMLVVDAITHASDLCCVCACVCRAQDK